MLDAGHYAIRPTMMIPPSRSATQATTPWRQLLQRPDEVMLQYGAGGELLVAKMRAGLSLLVLALPLISALGGGSVAEVLIGLGAAIAVNIAAQVFLALARRAPRWLPYLSGTYDATMTTLVLLTLAWHEPAAGLNSMVVWCFYVIAIGMTALRNDLRLTLLVGMLCVLQFGLLAVGVFALHPQAGHLSTGYGTASPSSVAERLVLLVMVTLLMAAVVYRMQRLVRLTGEDAATGLPNRLWLQLRLPQLLLALRNSGTSVSLVLLQIDRFGPLVDDRGQHAADALLLQLVARLRQMLRDGEHLVRLSRDEFVLVLQVPLGTAWERIERWRAGTSASAAGEGSAGERMPISAGLAGWPQDGGDATTLLRKADACLQAARQRGGDCVVARID